MSRIIAGIDESAGPGAGSRRPVGTEWVVLGVLGGAFALMSIFDVALALYPVGFGSPEWEFTTATAVMNNLPLGVVGIGLMAVAGIGRRSAAITGVAAVLAGLLGLIVLLMGVLFVKNLGVAIESVTDPVLRQGLTESVARTSIQLVAYLVALGWLAWRSRVT